MPSPFPGVDPYIESQGCWRDFRLTFLVTLSEILNDSLLPRYVSRINDRPCPFRYCPDIGIVREEGARATFLEIRRLRQSDPVTVITLFSEDDKTEPGMHLYESWVRDCRLRSRSVVEIDLLHGGLRSLPGIPGSRGDYYALVWRSDGSITTLCWGVRDPLPMLSIPLPNPDPDVAVDLGAVFATTWNRPRYERYLDYSLAPTAIDESDREWAMQIARSAAEVGSAPPPA
jgi:hypothetical protein